MIDSATLTEQHWDATLPSKRPTHARNTISYYVQRVSFAGSTLLAIFGLIAFLSESNELADGHNFIVSVVALLVLASVVAIAGLSQALHVKPSEKRKLLFIIVCFALGLRGVAIFTPPILEVDFYRYLWDGKVSSSGISPYAYSPSQILAADSANAAPNYRRAVSRSIESESNHTILSRVHFADFTTIYPPVSQLVFAATMRWFPEQANVTAHVVWLKIVLVLFDIATMAVLGKLLLLQGRSVGWLIAYAWNPLVIKEIANSAHLDSIAVFFVMAAVYGAALSLADRNPVRARAPMIWSLASGLCLGLGFGAKLFPIVLAPMFIVVFAKIRWATACCFLIAFMMTASGCLWIHYQGIVDRSIAQQYFDERSPDQVSDEGLESFLSKWRMNDVIFSGIYRNLRPDSGDGSAPWFVVTPNVHRETIVNWCRQRFIGGDNPAFFLSRMVTMTVFLGFYSWLLLVTLRSSHELEIDRFAWVLAVFLFIQPTVNPWYWVWVAPLACFSNSKGWLVVSGLLSIYYLRFWFEDLPLRGSTNDTSFAGVGMFDYGVAWLEFAAILVVATFCFIRSHRVRPARPS